MKLDKYPMLVDLTPAHVKTFSEFELTKLAQEIRKFLVVELSKRGGHLAPNLGVVELTIALFRVFNSPKDTFFWDIGHQTYVHKILTGRAARFDTLRQYDGLSGFIHAEESVHDVWEAGHASTSLSGAVGLSIQNALTKKKAHVVSIIGDGALGGGMALEALNHIGDLKLPHIIVLNDNAMSISKNVGALNKHITELRMNPKYLKMKSGTKIVLSRAQIGHKVTKTLRDAKASLKFFMLRHTDNNFFSNMGIEYVGPIDGHDISQLESAFRYAKRLKRPTLIHIITTKGKGYNPAEADEQGSWHGIGPYSVSAGRKLQNKPVNERQWSSVVSETVERLAAQDNSIIAITPAMIKGSKLTHFGDKFPKRLFDVGIAESHATTLAAGAAIGGKVKPFLAIYSTFLQRSYDQVLHDIAKQHLPVVIGVDRCGFAGGDGPTHHGVYDIAFLRTIPDMVIAMGRNDIETQHLLYSAFYQYKKPTAIRYPRGYSPLRYVDTFTHIPLGTWEMLAEGKTNDYVILTFGPQLKTAVAVKTHFKHQQHISIVNARFIKPLDEQMLHRLFARYKTVITLEEGTLNGGFGSAILAFAATHGYHNRVRTYGLADIFYPQGDAPTLQALAGIDAATIIKQIEAQDNEKRTKTRSVATRSEPLYESCKSTTSD